MVSTKNGRHCGSPIVQRTLYSSCAHIYCIYNDDDEVMACPFVAGGHPCGIPAGNTQKNRCTPLGSKNTNQNRTEYNTLPPLCVVSSSVSKCWL